LRESISDAQASLRRLRGREELLRARQAAIKQEISRLTSAAQMAEEQLKGLRGQYTMQVRDLRMEYKQAKAALKLARDKEERMLAKNDEERSQLRQEIIAQVERLAFYKQQAKLANDEASNIHRRAESLRADELESRDVAHKLEDLTSAVKAAEQRSKGRKKTAEVESDFIDQYTKINARASAAVAARDSRRIQVDAETRVEEKLEAAAKAAADAAAAESKEKMKEASEYAAKAEQVDQELLSARAEKAQALLEERKSILSLEDAKEEYDRIMAAIEQAENETRSENSLVDLLDAKLRHLETEGKLAQLKEEGDAALADLARSQGEKELQAMEEKQTVNEQIATDEKARREQLLSDMLQELGEDLAAHNLADSLRARAEFVGQNATAAMERAEKRDKEADTLLGSVYNLGVLAREAAEVAARERVKAQGVVPCGSSCVTPVAAVANPSVSVHVVPNGQ